MDLSFNDDDRAFEAEVRAFIDEHWPAEARGAAVRATDVSFGDRQKQANDRWFAALVERGWSVPNWPVEHGGTGWTPTQKYIWDRETAMAGCPRLSPFGASMLAPVLYTWGADWQKEEFLPKIRENAMQWCQGYSEPGAGSDLAQLQTKAVREGDEYVINGTKIWTSSAHLADWMFCLCRTDAEAAKPQQGISFILIPMDTPGISVEPILILGNQHSVNTVFLENVRVPVKNLVGEENKGWTYAKGLLTHERTGIAGVARSKANLAHLKTVMADTGDGLGAALADDTDFVRKVHETEVDLLALEFTELRTLATVEQGGAPGPESSILKIRGTEIGQRIADLHMEAFGYYGAPYPDALLMDNEGPIGPDYVQPTQKAMLYGRASSVFGGSNEIQKNIISKAVLGL